MIDIFKTLGILNGGTTNYISPIDKGILGHGITLVPLDIPNNQHGYGNLYRNGIKLNDTIFRIGGLCNGFNNKSYCNLIKYEPKSDNQFDLGKHCIIDANGDIVLITDGSFDNYPYYLKGCIATMGKVYYNLVTKKPICRGNKSIESKEFLFVENSYDFDNKNKDESLNFPLGVYKIDYITGEVQLFK